MTKQELKDTEIIGITHYYLPSIITCVLLTTPVFLISYMSLLPLMVYGTKPNSEFDF